MFKKFLSISIFIFAFLISVNQSQAFTSWNNDCIATSTTESITVISGSDLNGDIPICVKVNTAILPITIADGGSGHTNPYNPFEINQKDGDGFGRVNYNFTFSSSTFDNNSSYTERFPFSGADKNGNPAEVGELEVNVNAAAIELNNSKTLPENGTILKNDSITFNCINSTYMSYYPDANSNIGVSNVGTANGYTIEHSPTMVVGTHKIECGNIGGASTMQSFVYTVNDPTPITRAIVYKANGGVGDDIVFTINDGYSHEVISFQDSDFSRAQNSFVEWNTQSGAGGTSYYADNLITPSQPTTTLYVIWNQVTGSLDADPNPCTYSSLTASGCNTTLDWDTFNTFTPTGVSAITSNLDNSGNVSPNFQVATGDANVGLQNIYIPGKRPRLFYLYNSSIELASVSVYAIDISSPINIIAYNANGGTGSMESDLVDRGASTTVKQNAFSKTEATFVNWNRAQNGSGTTYTPDQVFTPTDSFTLYAQWRNNPSGIINLSSDSCAIAENANSCTTTLSWEVTDAVATPGVRSNVNNDGNPHVDFVIGDGITGTRTVTIPYSSRDFFLYDNAVLLHQITVNSYCDTGLMWSTSSSMCIIIPSDNPVTVTANDQSDNTGSDINISWTSNGNSCEVKYSNGWSYVSFSPANVVNLSNPTDISKTFSTTLETSSLSAGNYGYQIVCTDTNDATRGVGTDTMTLTLIDPDIENPFGNINFNSCTIADYSNSCNANLNWNTSNTVDVPAITSNVNNSGIASTNFSITSGYSGTVSVSVKYSSRQFFLYDNGVELDRETFLADCGGNSYWDESQCVPNIPMSGTLNANNCTILMNSSSCNTSLSWSTVNPVAVSAVTSNKNNSGATSSNFLIANANSGTSTVLVPYTGRSFYLYNNGVELSTKNIVANCENGSSWDGSKCASDNPMSGTLSGNACTIAIDASYCNTDLSWNTINPVAVSSVTSDVNNSGATSSNFLIANGNSSTTSVVVKYPSRNFYLYNNSVQLSTKNIVANCQNGSTWNGSKCADDNPCITPVGSVKQQDGSCGCTTGQYDMGGTCTACPQGEVFDPITETCMLPASTPACAFIDGSDYNKVECSYKCRNNISPTFYLINNGNPNPVGGKNMANFDWDPVTRLYSFVCPVEADNRLLPALKKLYTHFVSFNVSAGYIKKGSDLNLAWMVELPNDTCKIEGKSIKTGNTIFTTENIQNIDNNISTSTGSTVEDYSVGDYKTIMNAYYKISESTRFTASCINTNSYKNGRYQLLRDVYVIDEAER